MMNLPLSSFLLAGIAAIPATAQNVTSLANLNTRGHCAGVWGYTAPDGREFAIVGARQGTWIVETTDPVNPVEIAHLTAPPSSWREVTMYRQYVYSVSEAHSGIRIIDMSNPSSPQDLGYVFQSTWPNSHSITIDPDAGRLYINGTRNGMYILDVATNPASPTIIGRYTTNYVHDSYVRRGKAYLSEIYDGNLRIVDVTNPANLVTVSATQTPGAFTHNAAVSDDDELLITSDENATGYMQAYDIRNPAAPLPLGSYVLPGEIVHNVFMIGRTAYMAAYSAGFHMVDLANPSSLTKLASYDTSPSYTSNFHGSWGCYPFQDSGVIYMSDRETGLHLLQVDCGHLNRYGDGTPGVNAAVPRAIFDGASPAVGAAGLRLEIENLAPSAAFVTLVSTASAAVPLLGIDLLVDLNSSVGLGGTAQPDGSADLPLPIPADPTLANARIYMQIVGVDAAGPQGLSASRGMWFGICP